MTAAEDQAKKLETLEELASVLEERGLPRLRFVWLLAYPPDAYSTVDQGRQ